MKLRDMELVVNGMKEKVDLIAFDMKEIKESLRYSFFFISKFISL